MNVLLDTDALLYLTLDPAGLSEKAKREIEKADNIYVSSISLWEIGIMSKNKRIRLPLDLERFCRMIREIDDLEIIPVSDEIWIKNINLPWRHSDPADRTIAATAHLYDSRLITSNEEMRKYYKKSVW